jgi:hypothetical protein
MGVATAFLVAKEPTPLVYPSVLYPNANKTRDRAWTIGDQAMKKDSNVDVNQTGGCSIW